MNGKTFVGIVSKQGATTTEWIGAFDYDDIEGYFGSILSTTHRPQEGKDLFALPELLEGETLYCVVDGSELGTIVWPEFRDVQIKNFVAHIRTLKIRNLIKGIHIGNDEYEITKLRIESPIVARLFDLKAFQTTLHTAPSFGVTIRSNTPNDLEFPSNLGKVFVGISGYIADWNDTPALSTKAHLTLHAEPPLNPSGAIRIARKIEQLFSLLTLDYVKAHKTSICARATNKNGEWSEQHYEIERARLSENAKTKVDPSGFALCLSQMDFASVLNHFLEIYSRIEQTLHWYRIVTIEDRYLEDKFFYSVRMIEALYKALRIPVSVDQSANEGLTSVVDAVNASGNQQAIDFLTKRALPIFSRPSLTNILADVRSKYADLAVVEFLDHKIISRLRGKEAHGSAEPFSPSEYRFMACSYDVLRVIYVLIILDACGIPRSFIIDKIRASHRFQHFFEREAVERLLAGI